MTTAHAPEEKEFLEGSYEHNYAETETIMPPNETAFSEARQSSAVSCKSQSRSLQRRSRSNRRYARSKPKAEATSANLSEESPDEEENNTLLKQQKSIYTNMYLDPSYDINLSKQNSAVKQETKGSG